MRLGRMMRRRGVIPFGLIVAVVLLGGSFAVAGLTGVIGPKNKIQPNGRRVHPTGRTTLLGNHPNGGTLTPDGRYLWTLSAGRGINDIRVVRVRAKHSCKHAANRRHCNRRNRRGIGKVVQRIRMPGLSGGIAMDPEHNRVYVSGLADSSHADEQSPASVPGQEGDVIHVFRYKRHSGKAKRAGIIPVPPPTSAPAYQTFPPNSTEKLSWPQELAISPDGKTVLAALNLADSAAVIDTRTKAVRYVPVGHYPYGAAIDRQGNGWVTSETGGTVTRIDLGDATAGKATQVGSRLSHPEGIAVDPRHERAYVAVTAQDLIAVLNTRTGAVTRTISVARPQGNGTAPIRVAVTGDGCYLMSADSGEDAIALIALPRKHGRTCKRGAGKRPAAWRIVGRVPTGAYPVAAAATPGSRKLVYVTAKGKGVGPNPNGPDPTSPANSDDTIGHFSYLPSIVRGVSGVMPFPTAKELRHLTPIADREIHPINHSKPPAGTPIRSGGPIKHVFYVVKENRTYDQLLGDDSRGDGDPGLTLFGKHNTPNLHALAKRFPLLDHVYADSEASIDGHYWTAAGAVSDYVIRNWHQNYAGRGRPYDFGSYQVSAPPKGYIFQRMLGSGISFFNFGEALAGLSPLPDKDQTPADLQLATQLLANSDIGLAVGAPFPVAGSCYDSDLSNSTVLSSGQVQVYDSTLPPGAPAGSHSRFACFQARFQMQLLSDSVPQFTYIVLPNDHTEGTTPGRRTPQAQIASNDWALGEIVDEISHSSVWSDSMILVQEDDSQDGADHVDAHRIPALAISPYAKRGAVVHTRYDQLSILRTAERTLGLKPVNLAEALALPMYEAFSSSAHNSAPYSAIKPGLDMTAVNPPSAPKGELSAQLPLGRPDLVSQGLLDRILWKAVHGVSAEPPPPGPNASSVDPGDGEEAEAEGAAAGDESLLPRVRAGTNRNLRLLRARVARARR
jgi:YVTN family beta-propeller protein